MRMQDVGLLSIHNVEIFYPIYTSLFSSTQENKHISIRTVFSTTTTDNFNMAALSTVIVVVTDFTTLDVPSTSFVPATTLKTMVTSKTSRSVSTLSKLPSVVTSVSTLTSSESSVTPTPTVSGYPNSNPATSIFSKNNHLVNLALAAIILITLLYLFAICFGIVLWFKGRCPKCAEYEDRICSLENGTAITITKETVRERERYIAEEEAQERAKALAALEGNSEPDTSSRRNTWAIFDKIWAGKGKGEERVPTPGPESGLGYGTSSHLPPATAPETELNQPHASSVYSQPTLRQPSSVYLPPEDNGERRRFRNNRFELVSQFEPYMEGGPVPNLSPVPGPSNLGVDQAVYLRAYEADKQKTNASDGFTDEQLYMIEPVPSNDPDAQAYRHAAALAANADNPDREDAQNYADRLLQNIRKRQREGGYGGLPDPEEFVIDDKETQPKTETKWAKVKKGFGRGK
jgi:hypothetical protein